LAFTSTWPKAIRLDEAPVALCCFHPAAFAASRRPPVVWKAPSMLAYATPIHEPMPSPQSVRVARSKWTKPLFTKPVLMGAYSGSAVISL
jgi:hypothetical protein